MAAYSKPGAYIQWQDATSAAIGPLRTDIAGFVGLAERGPLDTPVAVESQRQFEAHFGSFIGGGFLAYAVRGFFENGGKRCWIVRVAAAGGGRPAVASSTVLQGVSGGGRFRVDASSPGVWGDGITFAVNTIFPASTLSLRVTSMRFAEVDSVAKFNRGDLVRISQSGVASPLIRVIALVDPLRRRLYFVHPDAGQGLPYDRPLVGIDGSLPIHITSIGYSISVRENGFPIAFYPRLGSIPESASYGPLALSQPPYPLVLSPGQPLPAPPPPIVLTDLATDTTHFMDPLAVVQGKWLSLQGGADGLADLAVHDFVGYPVSVGASDVEKKIALRGLRAIDLVDEVAIVAAPDIVVQPETPPVYQTPEPPHPNPCLSCPPPLPPTVLHQPPLSTEQPPQFSDDEVYLMQSLLVQLCEERNDRIAILDVTSSMAQDAALGFPALQEWRTRFDTRNAALYYPWLHVVDPLAVAPTRRVPPSGHVAGVYAQWDLAVGVHRAPANSVLQWAEDVTTAVDDTRHGELNTTGVNVLRALPGMGLRVLGARTLSSDPTWRFVNVRRLVMMVMKAIHVSTQWAVFEPNDARTRAKIAQALTEFLTALWARGALVGSSPGEALVVRCDEMNNPRDARDSGQLQCDVAIAPSQPFEFVVLRVGRQDNAFEILEVGSVAGGRS
jgi:hypothetical protein